MYLNSKSYKKKYLKSKHKYQLLKNYLGCVQEILLNGGDYFLILKFLNFVNY
jgi:hypothetical protein